MQNLREVSAQKRSTPAYRFKRRRRQQMRKRNLRGTRSVTHF